MKTTISSKTSQELKSKVLEIMKKMLGFVKEYPKAELTAAPDEFVLAKDLLEKGEFNLAVCGKVKNGKSSLINALIGRELLPVCTDVATSRVFKISHADKDSFFVVYANGDRKEIKDSQLKSYGSQAEADNNGQLETDKTIAYIEVNTKLDFLPKGVSILDTPGIGSTYPQHTTITKQYLKFADAALFVANPTPLEKIETDFLKEIAEITPNIMFVTTKADENGNESVENSIASNVKKIQDSIGDKLYRGVRMFKMSSVILLEAAKATDKDSADFQLEISGFNEVKEEILTTVFLTQGYYRAGVAYNATVKYYQMILGSLQNRLNEAKKSGEEYQVLLNEYENARRLFSEQMGDNKRMSVLNEVESIINTMDYDFNQTFSADGDLIRKYDSEIDAQTTKTIAEYSEGLGEKIVGDVQKEWNSLTTIAYGRMCEAVNKYNNDCQMILPDSINILNPNYNGDPEIADVQFEDKMSAVRTEMLTAGMIPTTASTVVGALAYFAPAAVTPAAPVVVPVLVLMGVGALIWGAISGGKKAQAKQLAKNQGELKKFIRNTISDCKKQLIGMSLQDGKYQSLYQGFASSVREQAKKTISDTYEKYKKVLDARKQTLVEARQNPKLIEALEMMLKSWQTNKSGLQDVKNQLENIKLD